MELYFFCIFLLLFLLLFWMGHKLDLRIINLEFNVANLKKKQEAKHGNTLVFCPWCKSDIPYHEWREHECEGYKKALKGFNNKEQT